MLIDADWDGLEQIFRHCVRVTDEEQVVAENDLAVAMRDGFPVSPGRSPLFHYFLVRSITNERSADSSSGRLIP